MCELCDMAIEATEENEGLGCEEYEQLKDWLKEGQVTACEQKIRTIDDPILLCVLRAYFLGSHDPGMTLLYLAPSEKFAEILDLMPPGLSVWIGCQLWIIEVLQARACRILGTGNSTAENNAPFTNMTAAELIADMPEVDGFHAR